MLFCLMVGACMATGCDGGARDPGQVLAAVHDSAGVEILEYPASALVTPAPFRLADEPAVRIGVVEGAAPYQWTRPVAGARLSDGAIVVAEQLPAELRLFDADGVFVRSIGRAGDGPGEFGTLNGVAALPGDTLLTWDAQNRRLSWFTRDGALVRETTIRDTGPLQALRAVALGPGNGGIVVGSMEGVMELANRGRIRETWGLVPVSSAGELSPSIGQVPGRELTLQVQGGEGGVETITSINVSGRWWWGEGFVAASPGGIWTADRLVPEARHHGIDGGLDRIVRLPDAEREFNRALIDSLHQRELARAEDPDMERLLRDDIALREYPEGVPPVDGIFVERLSGDGPGSDGPGSAGQGSAGQGAAAPESAGPESALEGRAARGRVWLGLTEFPREALPSGGLRAIRSWFVEGEGMLTLPRLSHPIWADGAGVLLVRNDEVMGVAFVEWYPYVAR